MANILQLETTTTNCSVSVAQEGRLLAIKEQDSHKYSHSEQLHPFIKEVLHMAQLDFGDLHAIAVSKGPGSYTGLRIGVSAAKGLCFSLDIPLIGVDSLDVLAAATNIADGVVVCMLDARRMEAYTAIYNSNKEQIRGIEAEIFDTESYGSYLKQGKVYLYGNCVEKTKEVLEHPNFEFLEEKVPSSAYISALAYDSYQKGTFEDLAYFEPFYLKDFVVNTKQ
ncbi:MAG: tRNA (adenosine(37)-N6)-threonylcarbamoyltransferase complex dimerization subunit type 1 TsaB [Flavobacteriaceae bacterium]|nr:tRNA (adenosine(37)-N6)-threonylcarbamoyltransferase complex dimerization subunit type 1 TsaB [Flavobacteriaceae bacterium]